MIVGTRRHTINNRRRWVVDYSQWLDDGHVPSTFVAVSSSATLTVDGAAVLHEGRCVFFTNGGVVGETAVVTFTMTDNRQDETQIKHDSANFVVVAQ